MARKEVGVNKSTVNIVEDCTVFPIKSMVLP